MARSKRAIVAAGAVVALGLAAAWLAFARRADRVIVLGLDGLDPRAVDLLMSEGKLPHFARLRQDGAYARLQSSQPLLSPVIWTTIATGKTPEQHGIGHFTALDQSTGDTLPVTSSMRQAKALWNILSDRKRTVAVVGWWASWPAETVNGWIVSDHTCYHFLFPEDAAGPKDARQLTFPAALADSLAPLIRRPSDISASEAAAFIHVAPEELSRPFDFQDDVSHFKWALATAESYKRIGLKLWREQRPDVLMAYTEGTDSIAHLFGHLFRAQGLSGELLEQQRRYGDAVESMYLYADRLVGEYLDAMDSRTTLVVLSDHGFNLGAEQDDPSKTRDMRRVSEHFHNLEGILYLYGNHVRKHSKLETPRILDVAPTLLTLVGLPLASDMPGRALTEGLTLAPRTPKLATYESGPTAVRTVRDATADPEVLERLRSLGYIANAPAVPAASPSGPPGIRSPMGERNIAALNFQAGRYAEAAAAYTRLIGEEPNDAALHTSLAGALGAMGRYDEALAHLETAIRIEPLNVEAYHNKAVVLERKGQTQQAIELYRKAVRYAPQYEASRKALVRLTGSGDVDAPQNAAEKRAFALAQEASVLARRGDYPAAMSQLDKAAAVAPRYLLVYHYRSNVAYLMGDRAAAERALEKCLELDPGNAFFQANLERLRKKAAAKR